ncbi:MAG: hypothetical protein QXM83_04150 [Ignisphaera sp.]
MAKLNTIKIGQGVLIGVDTLIGGYAYTELSTGNLVEGILIGLLALVIAIIAFAPELEADMSTIVSQLKTELPTAPATSNLTAEALDKYKTDMLKVATDIESGLQKLATIDPTIGKAGITENDIVAVSNAISPIINSILTSKSITSDQLKTLANGVSPILASILKKDPKLINLLVDALSDPAILNIINALIPKII